MAEFTRTSPGDYDVEAETSSASVKNAAEMLVALSERCPKVCMEEGEGVRRLL